MGNWTARTIRLWERHGTCIMSRKRSRRRFQYQIVQIPKSRASTADRMHVIHILRGLKTGHLDNERLHAIAHILK